MIVINLFAGPGAGKSTTASGLFYRMKKEGLNVELVTEYAKEKVWDEHTNVLNDQLYVACKQNRRLARLEGKVDYAITDSPIILSQYYSKYDQTDNPYLYSVVEWMYDQYTNVNVFIERTKPYNQSGRIGGYKNAIEADKGIRAIVEEYDNYIIVKDDDHVVDKIYTYIFSQEQCL